MAGAIIMNTSSEMKKNITKYANISKIIHKITYTKNINKFS